MQVLFIQAPAKKNPAVVANGGVCFFLQEAALRPMNRA
jgi:hypothetical protein